MVLTALTIAVPKGTDNIRQGGFETLSRHFLLLCVVAEAVLRAGLLRLGGNVLERCWPPTAGTGDRRDAISVCGAA